MSNHESEKSILSELVRAREAIKKKCSSIKQEREDMEKVVTDTLKPVISPLEKLVDSKMESIQPSSYLFNTSSKKTAKKQLRFNPTSRILNSTLEEDNYNEDEYDEDFVSMDDTVMNSTFKSAYDKNETTDFLSMLDTSRSQLDNVYEVRQVGGINMIGDSEIQFDDKTIRVGNLSYPKTNGLMELLFLKQPNDNLLSTSDRRNYRSILEATSAHRKKHSKNESLRTSKSRKYHSIIEPMFRSCRKNKSTTGAGLLPKYKIAKNNSTVNLVYWDNPNELVDRLRLLIAERSAGNNNHDNEIQSIIEELREAGHIY